MVGTTLFVDRLVAMVLLLAVETVVMSMPIPLPPRPACSRLARDCSTGSSNWLIRFMPPGCSWWCLFCVATALLNVECNMDAVMLVVVPPVLALLLVVIGDGFEADELDADDEVLLVLLSISRLEDMLCDG